jgi:hypothetical protein
LGKKIETKEKGFFRWFNTNPYDGALHRLTTSLNSWFCSDSYMIRVSKACLEQKRWWRMAFLS